MKSFIINLFFWGWIILITSLYHNHSFISITAAKNFYKNIVIYHDKTIDTELCKNGESLPIKYMTLDEIKKYDCNN